MSISLPLRRIREKFGHDCIDRTCIIADGALLILGVVTFLIGVCLYFSEKWMGIIPVSYSPLSGAFLSFATGIGVIMISFVGFMGISIHRRVYLLLYVFFVLLLIALQLFVLFAGNNEEDHTMLKAKSELRRNLNYTHIKPSKGQQYMEISWDEIQNHMKCCGIDGPSDWHFTQRFPKNEHVPDSCCIREKFADGEDMANCGKVPQDSDHIKTNGCYGPLVDYIYSHVRIINIFTILLLIVEIVGLVSHAYLYMRIWRERKAKERRRHEHAMMLDKDHQMHSMDRMGDANDP